MNGGHCGIVTLSQVLRRETDRVDVVLGFTMSILINDPKRLYISGHTYNLHDHPGSVKYDIPRNTGPTHFPVMKVLNGAVNVVHRPADIDGLGRMPCWGLRPHATPLE